MLLPLPMLNYQEIGNFFIDTKSLELFNVSIKSIPLTAIHHHLIVLTFVAMCYQKV